MKPIHFLTIFVLALSALLTACSGTPTEATKASPPTAASNPTKGPAAVTPGYPAPTGGANPTVATQPAGYPAPVQNLPQPTTAGYPAPNAGLRVTAADGSTKMVEGSALLALAKSKVNLDGKDIEVRKLADALKAAGIAAFSKVSVNGANGTLALTKDQVAQAYLDIAADGSIALDVQGMSKDKWISGVQTIKID